MIKDIIKNMKLVGYVVKFCPLYVISSIFHMISNTIQMLAKVYLIKYLTEQVEYAIENNVPFDVAFKTCFDALLLYFIVLVITTVVMAVHSFYVDGKYSTIYIFRIQQLMWKKTKSIDLADFDNPEFYDMYSRALRDGTWRGVRVYRDFMNFISSLLTTLTLGTFIAIVASDIWLILILLVSTFARIIIANRINVNTHKYDTLIEPDRRMYNYVNRTFYQQRFAAEMKTTSIGHLLIDKCHEAQKRIDKEYRKTYSKNTLLSSLSTFLYDVLNNGAIYVYLGFGLLNGLTIDVFTSMISATSQFSTSFYDVASYFSKVKLNSLYIDYFLDYMKYQPKLENLGTKDLSDEEKFSSLTFDNVTFSYPNTNFNALENINLKITKGEKLAIVGLNGAGKTTLTKLLLKFYNPNVGEIYYNNQTIRETKEKDIRSKFSIIFQDYRIYGVSIAENVLMREVKTKEDDEIVIDALTKVGLYDKISKLPEGIHTVYSREFSNEGLQLSGGEAQRLAIARVFASNASIYILDEPTSSLDPLAERDINRLILEKAKDKTIIIIAHRLSTVVDCDKIILIEYGKIIEEGTHEELINLNGKYKNMFVTQASLYVHEEDERHKRRSSDGISFPGED